MNIGIIGSGIVGQTVGGKLVALGHDVVLGSRRGKAGAPLWSLLLAAGLVLALPPVGHAGARAGAVRIVARYSFAAGQTPENLAIDRDGTIYVSLAYASTISRLSPLGFRTALVLPTHGGIVVGVAIDQYARALDIAVRSKNAGAAGIWQVALADFGSRVGLRRLAVLPTAAFPNGMSFDELDTLYVADSSLGCIWRRPHGARQAEVWSSDVLLAPNGTAYHGFPLPGANGVHAWGHALYISNTSTSTIVRIPIEPDGGAGAASVRFRGVQADDFAFDAHGTMYVAANLRNAILRVAPSGRVTTLATKATAGLDYPTAVAFGTRPRDRTVLYITNAAYFSPHPRPSVEALPVGVPGAAVS